MVVLESCMDRLLLTSTRWYRDCSEAHDERLSKESCDTARLSSSMVSREKKEGLSCSRIDLFVCAMPVSSPLGVRYPQASSNNIEGRRSRAEVERSEAEAGRKGLAIERVDIMVGRLSGDGGRRLDR